MRRLDHLCLIADVAARVEDESDLLSDATGRARVVEQQFSLCFVDRRLQERDTEADDGGENGRSEDVPLEAPQ